jgi:hypothetical protein
MRAAPAYPGIPVQPSAPVAFGARSALLHLARIIACGAGAAGLFVCYQHFKVSGQSGLSTGSLIGAALLALVPVRALLHEFFGVESKVLHLVHGLGGLALVALPVSGLVSGAPMLTHAAMAPFAIMGAAQAFMHQNNPRNAQQAEAMRRFATSLPEVAQFTKSGDLSSPANISRAITVLTDLLGKAQAVGETELQADPGFQSALSSATTKVGLTLGLDSIDHAVNLLSANSADPAQVRALRKKLAQVRGSLETSEGQKAAASPGGAGQ